MSNYELEKIEKDISELKKENNLWVLRFRFALNNFNLIQLQKNKLAIFLLILFSLFFLYKLFYLIFVLNMTDSYKIFFYTSLSSLIIYLFKKGTNFYKNNSDLIEKIKGENIVIKRKLQDEFNLEL